MAPRTLNLHLEGKWRRGHTGVPRYMMVDLECHAYVHLEGGWTPLNPRTVPVVVDKDTVMTWHEVRQDVLWHRAH